MSKQRTWIETRLLRRGHEPEIELDIEFQYVDNGIGSYEYWGAKGNHSSWEIEFVNAKTKDGNDFPVEDDELIRNWEEGAILPDNKGDDTPPDCEDE